MLFRSEPSAKAFQTLYQLYQRSAEQYRADRKLACDMIGTLSVTDEPATAALVVVANTLFNLDEVVMKY